MSTREEIISTIHSVPAMPTVAVKVSQMLQDSEIDVSEVVKVIEYDPGLSANVLRLANSAYFAGPKSIGSIKQAIIRLGMNKIQQLLVTSAVAPIAKQAVKGYDLSPGDLWEHSIATAIGAEELAAALKKEAPDYAFTAALLHDIGKVVLGTFVEIDAGPIMELAFKEGLSFESAEQKVLGIDHAEVGALLLQHWNLPNSVVDAVRWHQQPDNHEGEKTIVDLVHVADALSMLGGLGTGSDGLHYRISETVVKRLGLTIHMAEAVVCKILPHIEELRSFLSAGWEE